VSLTRADTGPSTATDSRRPVAATSRCSVGADGWRAPDSYALITL